MVDYQPLCILLSWSMGSKDYTQPYRWSFLKVNTIQLHAYLNLQSVHVAKGKCCKVRVLHCNMHVFQRARVATCTCCKVQGLQSAHVAKWKCCRVHVLLDEIKYGDKQSILHHTLSILHTPSYSLHLPNCIRHKTQFKKSLNYRLKKSIQTSI